MKKEFERVSELKEQMRCMLDKAEAEKRTLEDKEKEIFNALKTEKELLEIKIERRSLDVTDQDVTTDRRAVFAQAVDAIINHRSLENYNSTVSENGFKVTERATPTITDTTTISNITPVVIGDILEPLEKGLIIDKLGIKMQSGLHGDLVFPTLAAVEGSIAGENAAVGDSKLDIGKLTSSPKRVSISIPVSKRAINQSNFSLQDIVMKQLGLGIARLLNKWMFSGTKLLGASDGVFVKTAANVTYTGTPTFKNMVALETAVTQEGINVTDGTAAYICSSKLFGDLKSTPMEAGSPRMIIENGQMNGYPVHVTNYMDADVIGFGVFSYSAIGQFGEMDLIVDPYTGAKTNIVNFVINSDYDIITARPQAFAIAKKTI